MIKNKLGETSANANTKQARRTQRLRQLKELDVQALAAVVGGGTIDVDVDSW